MRTFGNLIYNFSAIVLGVCFVTISANADVIGGANEDLFALSGTGQSEVAAELRVAASMYDPSNVQPCLDQLSKCKVAHVDLPPPEIMLAVLHCTQGRPHDARTLLAKVEVEHSQAPSFALALARVNLMESRKVEALALIAFAEQQAAESNWQEERKLRFDIQCRIERAAIAESLEQWAKTKRLLEELVDHMPSDQDLQLRLAKSIFRGGSATAAAKRLREANVKDVELVIAQWHAEQGEADLAEKVLRDAAENQPENSVLQVALAQYLLDQRQVQPAKKIVQDLVDRAPEAKREVTLLMARLATSEGNWKDAVSVLQPLYRRSPEDTVVAVALSRALLATNDPAKIARGVDLAFAKASQQSGRLQTDSTLGWAQLQKGDAQAAEATLMAIASQYKISADTAYFTAQALAANGKEALAQELMQRAMESKGPFDLRLHAEQWLASVKPTVSEPELPFDDKTAIGTDFDLETAQ